VPQTSGLSVMNYVSCDLFPRLNLLGSTKILAARRSPALHRRNPGRRGYGERQGLSQHPYRVGMIRCESQNCC